MVSSRRFVDMGKLEPVMAAVAEAGVKVLYLEDLRAGMRLSDKLVGLLAKFLPELVDAFRRDAETQWTRP